jgi:hypothetical protein
VSAAKRRAKRLAKLSKKGRLTPRERQLGEQINARVTHTEDQIAAFRAIARGEDR